MDLPGRGPLGATRQTAKKSIGALFGFLIGLLPCFGADLLLIRGYGGCIPHIGPNGLCPPLLANNILIAILIFV